MVLAIKKALKIHRLQYSQLLPISLDEAWAFFSSPKNLNEITPDDMSFEIISGADELMYAGQIITYRIKPMFNIPMNWVTEITHVADKHYFIDEQRFGPYKFWHHLHRFEVTANGVLMTDILHYVLPFGLLGEIMGKLFIHQKVNGIFLFRDKKLTALFGLAKAK
ncbi:MAG: SRPBCC family protein [Cyclobacteriaceae bacterium]|nr:SRPBCC family protein [Cyclobacteriaceae bacterium]